MKPWQVVGLKQNTASIGRRIAYLRIRNLDLIRKCEACTSAADLVNAVILRNTVYLSRGVEYVRSQGAKTPGRPATIRAYRADRRLSLERN